MNYHFFAIKRAFHATLHIARDVAAGFGLTPARADMLYAIFRVPVARCIGPAGSGSLTQRELRKKLGVSAPTVSRMVRSLEALGIVTRRRSTDDRRTLDVSLTDAGRRNVRALFYEIFKWDIFGLAIDCALPSLGPPANEQRLERLQDDLYGVVASIRYAFRDRATLEYPGIQPEEG